MSKDWRDNKFGREADYGTLNESEDFKYVFLILLIVLGLLLGVGLLGWWLLTFSL